MPPSLGGNRARTTDIKPWYVENWVQEISALRLIDWLNASQHIQL